MRLAPTSSPVGRRLRSPPLALPFLLASALAQSPPPPASDAATVLPPFWVETTADARDVFLAPSFTLSRDALATRAHTTLKDQLADAPGVLLQDSFGGFEPPRLSIRGSGLQSAPSSRGVAFLLDGFPLGLADGSFNAALVEPQFASRLDLYRGDLAAPVAPAVLGGSFDLRTAARAPATLRVAAGSFGATQLSASSHAGAFSGAATFAAQDGFRAHSEQKRAALFGRADFSGCTVSLYRLGAAYDVPGPLTLAAATAAPRSASAEVLRDLPRRASDLTQATIRFARETDALSLAAGASWLRTNDWFRQLRANGLSDSRSDDLTVHAALARRFASTSGENSLRLATTLARGWRDLTRFRNDSSATGPRFGHDGLFATTASADLAATVALPENFSLAAGLAALAAHRDVSARLPANATAFRLHANELLPRARLAWSPRAAVSLHASVARAAEPPTFDDLLFVAGTYPNLSVRSQPLATQRATTCELGTSGRHGPFGWDFTAYTADWRDEILRLADASGQPRGAVNAASTRHRGLEASARCRLLDHPRARLTLVATAAWNRFTFVRDPVYGSNRLAGAPPHLGSASLLCEHPSGFFVAPALEWRAGATPVDHAGRLAYGGATLAHLRLGWRPPARSWSLAAEIQNLFDRPSLASTAGLLDLARSPAATALFLPAPPRRLSLTLSWHP